MEYANQRMRDIANAAAVLFLEQGYSKTQISHIAKAAGISVGSIYLDFTGKKEIMHFILKYSLTPDFCGKQLERPIVDSLFAGIEDEILELFVSMADDFEKYLGNTGNYRFEALLSDTFDRLARYGFLCLFIQKNAWEFKALSEQYEICQKRIHSAMTAYLSRYISLGSVRRVDNLELTALLILKTLSWWAMEAGYAWKGPKAISAQAAKAVCMENLLFAYKR